MMSESVPFRYNALKHQLQAQRAWINAFSHTPPNLNELLLLGTSVMDVYEGKLSPQEIVSEIQSQLTAAGHFGRPEFMAWIGTAGYRELTLTDKSRWVLRPGDTYERYIHIHPGRGGAFTFRAKANVLKTALLWRATSHSAALPDTHALNAVRAQLELSPVAEVEDAAHLKLLLGKL
jgi:hypothetical protein